MVRKNGTRARVTASKRIHPNSKQVAAIGRKLEEFEEQLERELKGVTLKQLRVIAGLTQEAAARACNVTLRTWIRWEKGEHTPESSKPYIALCRCIESNVRKVVET